MKSSKTGMNGSTRTAVSTLALTDVMDAEAKTTSISLSLLGNSMEDLKEKKMLIVLSDGAPGDVEATKQAIADARKKGDQGHRNLLRGRPCSLRR